MSFSELVPALQALQAGDKLRVIRFLSEELEKERLLDAMPKDVEMWSPIDVIDPEGNLPKLSMFNINPK